MILQLKLFLLEEREREKIFRNLELLLFSDSVCPPHFTKEEFEAQGGELIPAGLDGHGVISPYSLHTAITAFARLL